MNKPLKILGGPGTKTTPWPAWPQVTEREFEELGSVVRGEWSYNAPKELQFKKTWAEYIGVKNAYLVANGTVSLQIILEALDIGVGDEVIVPGLTWQATAGAVIDVNAVPILVDVCEDSWCIDPSAIEAAITPRTKAVICVHLYGVVCDMDAIRAITEKHNLHLIEDAAHQHGSVFRGKKIGSLGDAASFSLQNSKVLTCGEGGIITTDDDALGERIDALRNCGRRSAQKELYESGTGNYVSEGNLIQSGNYRITEFQAAILIAQFEKFERQTRRRHENALYLREILSGINGIRNMRVQAGTDVQAYFNFSFLYDSDAFGGLPVARFREALSEEINFPMTASYSPLNQCELYCPLTKQRSRLNPAYEAAIDPARFSLPVAERIFAFTSVCAHHKLLLGERADMEAIGEGILKIQAQAERLRKL